MQACTYLDLLPVVILKLEHAEMMLNGHNQAMAVCELLILGACDVCPVAERDHSGSGRPLVLVTEGTAVEGFLGLGKV